MTCIAGLTDNGSVYIAGDSAVNSGESHVWKDAGAKVFSNGRFLIGHCGLVRMGQIVRFQFAAPEEPNLDDNDERQLQAYLIKTFVPRLRDCVKEHGVLLADKGEEQINGALLIGCRGRLFEIDSAFTVTQTDDTVLAIGSGARLALGALHALSDSAIPPEQRLHRALLAAAHYDNYVRPPFFCGVQSAEGIRIINLSA
jgi:ATP-dependent protease HslVU (ClpYQ) peptidase subunit